LAVHLLEEFSKTGKQSNKRELGPYLDILPPKSTEFPLFYGDDEKKQLKGSEFLEFHSKSQNCFKADYNLLKKEISGFDYSYE